MRKTLFQKYWRKLKVLPPPGFEMAAVRRQRLEHLVLVDQPLVLISQANRSGGTLMAQLFTGHPECHVHPGEMHIGHPRKVDWPDLDLGGSPDRWFRALAEDRLVQYAHSGFVKAGRAANRDKASAQQRVYPFLFLRRFQRDVFRKVIASQTIESQRQIMDAYFTSYFNAWLDYQGLYEPKRFVVGFMPRLSSEPESVARYFRDYPDGRLITVIRDPKAWYVSLRAKKPEQRRDPRESIGRWMRSTEAALDNLERYGSRVLVIGFEDLIGDTEGTMREVADFLDLPFDEVIARPTYQGRNIRANSSFSNASPGVIEGPLQRGRELSSEHAAIVEEETAALYEKVLKKLRRHTGS
jgi:hypothetical protein